MVEVSSALMKVRTRCGAKRLQSWLLAFRMVLRLVQPFTHLQLHPERCWNELH